VIPMTPLEIAKRRRRMKTCLTCSDRIEINGVSYCEKDGKLIHPMLLDRNYQTECPDDIRRRNDEKRSKDV